MVSVSHLLLKILIHVNLEQGMQKGCIAHILSGFLQATQSLSQLLHSAFSAKAAMFCCCSVAQLCLTLHDAMDCSTPGLPVPHHLPEYAQVHVHCIGDVIQPSHPLMPSFPSALNLPQHQGLFQWVGYSHQVAKLLELHLQQPSFQWIFSPFGLTCLISLLSKGILSVFSSTTIWKHQFFGAQPSIWSNSHIHIWLLKKTYFDYMDLCW